MNKQLRVKIKESLNAVIPISLIVLILCITITPIPIETLMLFLFGVALLIVGMGLFSLGADIAMMPIGQHLGTQITKCKKVSMVIISLFIMGVLITIAEPDLQVLAEQTPAVPNFILILTVAIGVGLFLVISFIRILFKLSLTKLLIIFYSLIFIISIFVPDNFLPVAFDSGGVTTGPITVPFILSLGVGLTSLSNDYNSENDSFGLVALCSIGPILSVLILGIIYKSSSINYTPLTIPSIASTRDLFLEFSKALPSYSKEILIALIPILVFFLILQLLFSSIRKCQLIKIFVGSFYTFIGLTLFMTGINVGLMPAGSYIGSEIAKLPYYWILVPIGMIIGFFIVKAEPAVIVLNKQVEEITGGTISKTTMMYSLSIGMALSLGLSMIRLITGISLYWFLVPGYLISLSLSFYVPKVFTSIAFDSGGVASGPMTATFLLPFTMGACESLGRNILTDAFGIVAMVAMTPLIIIQILGLIYKIKSKKDNVESDYDKDEDIIDYD